MTENTNWTIDTLQKALAGIEGVVNGDIELALTPGAQPSIRLTLKAFGDLPIYIAVAGDQILADTTLIEVSRVKDPVAFNDVVLRSRDLFPLSSVGIERLADGHEVYCLFGALSAKSTLTVIIQEILTLADNVIRAAEAFDDHFIH